MHPVTKFARIDGTLHVTLCPQAVDRRCVCPDEGNEHYTLVYPPPPPQWHASDDAWARQCLHEAQLLSAAQPEPVYEDLSHLLEGEQS